MAEFDPVNGEFHLPLVLPEGVSKLREYVLTNVRRNGRSLGSGSYGSVEEVEVNGVKCAAKKLHEVLAQPYNDGAQSICEKFVEECRVMSKLRHPHIVQFLGVYFANQQDTSEMPWLVMEYLPSCLDEILVQRGRIHFGLKVSFMFDVSKGLTHLHNQTPAVIHRDLTARNVLINSAMVAKIADFGVARIVQDCFQAGEKVLQMTRVPGNAVYMPPEASNETNLQYSSKLDIFSFGVLLLFSIIQKFPCKLKPPTYPNPSNPQELLARTEIERRQHYFEEAIAISDLSSSLDQALLKLTRTCLHNDPMTRPNAELILTELMDMHRQCYTGLLKRDKLELIMEVTTAQGDVDRVRERVTEVEQRLLEQEGEIVSLNELIQQQQEEIQQGGHRAELERVRAQLEEATAEIKRMDSNAIMQESELATAILSEQRIQKELATRDERLEQVQSQLGAKTVQCQEAEERFAVLERQAIQQQQLLAARSMSPQPARLSGSGSMTPRLSGNGSMTPRLSGNDELSTSLDDQRSSGGYMSGPLLTGRSSYGEDPLQQTLTMPSRNQQTLTSFGPLPSNTSLPTLTTEAPPTLQQPEELAARTGTDALSNLRREKEILEAKLRTSEERNQLLENEQMDLSKRLDHEKGRVQYVQRQLQKMEDPSAKGGGTPTGGGGENGPFRPPLSVMGPSCIQVTLPMNSKKCAPSTHGKHGAQCVIYNHKLLLGGGDAPGDCKKRLLAFDLKSRKWGEFAVYMLSMFGMAVVHGQLYLVGGFDDGRDQYSSAVHTWNEQGKNWVKTRHGMPTARCELAAVGFRKWLIVAGGFNGTPLRCVEALNLDTSQWHTAEPLPEPAYGIQSTCFNDPQGDVFWYLLGRDSSLADRRPAFSVSLLRLLAGGSSQKWWTLPDPPYTCSGVVTVKGYLLAVGGKDRHNQRKEIYMYFPGTGEWLRVADLTHAKHSATCVSIGSKKFVVLAGKDDNDEYSTSVDQYNVTI